MWFFHKEEILNPKEFGLPHDWGVHEQVHGKTDLNVHVDLFESSGQTARLHQTETMRHDI